MNHTNGYAVELLCLKTMWPDSGKAALLTSIFARYFLIILRVQYPPYQQ